MIARYTRPAMGKIWDEQNKFTIWLQIEILACEAQAELGVIPQEAVAKIREKAKFEVARIDAIELEVKHDVIAFLTNVGEYVGPESRYIHLGMTSSDVLDTALAVQMKQSGELLFKGLEALRDVLARRAKEFKMTVMMGRSHGIHAEPTTFGLKLALWFDETRRNIDRLRHAIETISVGQVSGAVGTFEHLSPKVEEYALCKTRFETGPRVDTNSSARPSRRIHDHACGGGEFARKIRYGNPPSAKNRSVGSRRIFFEGTKRVFGDAAQTQPDYLRTDRRAVARSPGQCTGSVGECGTLARAGYHPFIRRTNCRSG